MLAGAGRSGATEQYRRAVDHVPAAGRNNSSPSAGIPEVDDDPAAMLPNAQVNLLRLGRVGISLQRGDASDSAVLFGVRP